MSSIILHVVIIHEGSSFQVDSVWSDESRAEDRIDILNDKFAKNDRIIIYRIYTEQVPYNQFDLLRTV
jgi:hypothetical protein